MDLFSEPMSSLTASSVNNEQLTYGFPFAHTTHKPRSLMFIGE